MNRLNLSEFVVKTLYEATKKFKDFKCQQNLRIEFEKKEFLMK